MITLVLCLTFSLCIMLIASVTAVTRTVGVSPGDWAKFDVSSTSNGTIDDTWTKNFLLSTWTNISVVDVSGTNITLHFTSHFLNGTIWYSDDYVDVTSGETTHAILALISAGLKTGDPIYANNSLVINETVNTNYLGLPNATALRPTNHVNVTGIDAYWDQATGAMVKTDETGYFGNESNPTGTFSFELTLVEAHVSSITIPECITPVLILSFLAVSLSAVVGYKIHNYKTNEAGRTGKHVEY